MFNPFEVLNSEERQKIYEFTYSIDHSLTGKEIKEFINTYYDLLIQSDYKRACGVELLLTDVFENTTSKRTKNKIFKFLKSIPGEIKIFEPQKYKIINN